jgi:hypothetical protein
VVVVGKLAITLNYPSHAGRGFVRSVGLANFDDAPEQITQLGAALTSSDTSRTEVSASLVVHQYSPQPLKKEGSAQKSICRSIVTYSTTNRLSQTFKPQTEGAAGGQEVRKCATAPLSSSSREVLGPLDSVQPWIPHNGWIKGSRHHHQPIVCCVRYSSSCVQEACGMVIWLAC